MAEMDGAEILKHLHDLDPDVSRVLWANFDVRNPVALSKPLQEARGVSRQAASQILSKLVKNGLLKDGPGQRPKTYEQPVLLERMLTFPLEGLEEHVVWSTEFRPVISQVVGKEALGIWEYGFTEILNNAREHSQGTEVTICARVRAGCTSLWIDDNGEGIFKRIARLCKLPDERQAILELAKGKLTTDPDNHSGEGVFFSSRAFEQFEITSGGLIFDHLDGEEDFLFERDKHKAGTRVWMGHGNHTKRTLKEVFDEFSVPDEYTFSKTVVPVKLARFGEEGLVSRSQAQRLLARVDRFKIVLFDFSDVETVGQAFADEIFRVYANAHPEVDLQPVHASPQVQQMIARATAMT
ncbi:STAS-like domain-containing protein [Burkholderia gladioli]|uniref:STAS-like domain-containing protein n=1 Tax=Burkholderia gladioli TaxID=28095 RepID=UPI003F78E708